MIIRNPRFRGYGEDDGTGVILGSQQGDGAVAVGVRYAYQNGQWMPIGPADGPNDEYMDQGLDVTPGTPKPGVSASEIAAGAGTFFTFLTSILGGAKVPPTYYPPPVQQNTWILPVAIGAGVLLLLGTGVVVLGGKTRGAPVGGYRLRRSRR